MREVTRRCIAADKECCPGVLAHTYLRVPEMSAEIITLRTKLEGDDFVHRSCGLCL